MDFKIYVLDLDKVSTFYTFHFIMIYLNIRLIYNILFVIEFIAAKFNPFELE